MVLSVSRMVRLAAWAGVLGLSLRDFGALLPMGRTTRCAAGWHLNPCVLQVAA